MTNQSGMTDPHFNELWETPAQAPTKGIAKLLQHVAFIINTNMHTTNTSHKHTSIIAIPCHLAFFSHTRLRM